MCRMMVLHAQRDRCTHENYEPDHVVHRGARAYCQQIHIMYKSMIDILGIASCEAASKAHTRGHYVHYRLTVGVAEWLL